ncbi:uncharacterized protein [Halyomorpha halys]|uniref:uncharacterized protein n=1 Tax=Halyomorpha halys TaxID=286706 RepID=UPI0006D4ED53|nr:uncharacterized protein LOC106688088 [Halyomorpha halys]
MLFRKVMHLNFVPLLFTISLFTGSTLTSDCPGVNKYCKGVAQDNKEKVTGAGPTLSTIEVRIVFNTVGKSRTTPSTTFKTVYLPNNLPISGDYEYVESTTVEATEDNSTKTTSKEKSNEKKRKCSTITKTNALVSQELMVTERSRRYIRNPYDFNLRYMLYPMNPDFFLAMEQSKLAESKLRNQGYMKKPDSLRNRRKTNFLSNLNPPWRSNLYQRLRKPKNSIINQPFL